MLAARPAFSISGIPIRRLHLTRVEPANYTPRRPTPTLSHDTTARNKSITQAACPRDIRAIQSVYLLLLYGLRQGAVVDPELPNQPENTKKTRKSYQLLNLHSLCCMEHRLRLRTELE